MLPKLSCLDIQTLNCFFFQSKGVKMPRKRAGVLPGVRRYGAKSNYTAEALIEALEKIRSGTVGQREAAKIYSIPRSTLKNKLDEKHIQSVGRPIAVNRDEEPLWLTIS